MAKKQYRIEIDEVTTDTLTALQNANIDYKLYEVNEVRKSSESFACGSNFATTELLLKPVNEIDEFQYLLYCILHLYGIYITRSSM